MEITVIGRNVAVTDALRAYAEKKVNKLQKYFERGIMDAQVSMTIERGIHSVDITIQVDGLLLRGEEHTGDMYASIDGLGLDQAVLDKANETIQGIIDGTVTIP